MNIWACACSIINRCNLQNKKTFYHVSLEHQNGFIHLMGINVLSQSIDND